jgi:hypothetical protein
MIDWLHQLPNAVIVLIFLICVIAPPLVLRTCVARLGRRPGGEGSGFSGLEAYKLVAPLTALLLTFSLVQAMGIAHAVDAAVDQEAANLVQLDRALARLPDARAQQLHVALQAYVRSVVEQEWPAQQQGRRSPETSRRFRALLAGTRGLVAPPGGPESVYVSVARTMDDVTDDRARRLGAAEAALPTIYWWVVIGLFMVLLGLSAFLPRGREWTVSVCAHAAALGLLMGLLFIVDRPLVGETSVSARPLQRALSLME